MICQKTMHLIVQFDIVLIGFVLLDHDNFLDRLGDVKVAAVLAELTVLNHGEIQDIVDVEVEQLARSLEHRHAFYLR